MTAQSSFFASDLQQFTGEIGDIVLGFVDLPGGVGRRRRQWIVLVINTMGLCGYGAALLEYVGAANSLCCPDWCQ